MKLKIWFYKNKNYMENMINKYSKYEKCELIKEKIRFKSKVINYTNRESKLLLMVTAFITIVLPMITLSVTLLLKNVDIISSTINNSKGTTITVYDANKLLADIRKVLAEHWDVLRDYWFTPLVTLVLVVFASSEIKHLYKHNRKIFYEQQLECVNIIIENYDLMHKSDNTYSINKIDEETITNKSKAKESLYIQCINNIKNKSCFFYKEDYDEADKLYLLIKEKYEHEIEFNKLNIKVEKIRVESVIGKYQNESMKYSLSMIVGIIASSIIIIIQSILSTVKVLPMIMTPLIIIIALFFLTRQANKSLRGDKISGLENHVRLKVLDELEKAIKYNNSSSNAILEVAYTKETEDEYENKNDE